MWTVCGYERQRCLPRKKIEQYDRPTIILLYNLYLQQGDELKPQLILSGGPKRKNKKFC